MLAMSHDTNLPEVQRDNGINLNLRCAGTAGSGFSQYNLLF